MIDDMLRQNWSRLHSHSIDSQLRHSVKAAWRNQLKIKVPKHSGSTGRYFRPKWSQRARPEFSIVGLRF